MKNKYAIPLLLLFVAVSSLAFFAKNSLEQKGIQADAVLYGNMLLFVVTYGSFYLLCKGMRASTHAGFLRSIYFSFMGKLFLCAIAAFVYIKTAAPVNKPAIYILLGLYVLYTFLEIRAINHLTRDIKNAKISGPR